MYMINKGVILHKYNCFFTFSVDSRNTAKLAICQIVFPNVGPKSPIERGLWMLIIQISHKIGDWADHLQNIESLRHVIHLSYMWLDQQKKYHILVFNLENLTRSTIQDRTPFRERNLWSEDVLSLVSLMAGLLYTTVVWLSHSVSVGRNISTLYHCAAHNWSSQGAKAQKGKT